MTILTDILILHDVGLKSNYQTRGGEYMPYKYVADFYVNNMRTKEEVFASESVHAKKLVEARYPNCKIRWVASPKKVN